MAFFDSLDATVFENWLELFFDSWSSGMNLWIYLVYHLFLDLIPL
jgi:hypothetical protein